MKKIAALLVISLFQISCSTEENNVKSSDLKTYQFDANEWQFYDEINQYRASLQLPLLEINEHISAVAKNHNLMMIERNELSHHQFTERSKYLKEILQISHVSENLANNFQTSRAVLNAWINSENHHKNLKGNYRYIGISIRKNTLNQPFYTVIFAR